MLIITFLECISIFQHSNFTPALSQRLTVCALWQTHMLPAQMLKPSTSDAWILAITASFHQLWVGSIFLKKNQLAIHDSNHSNGLGVGVGSVRKIVEYNLVFQFRELWLELCGLETISISYVVFLYYYVRNLCQKASFVTRRKALSLWNSPLPCLLQKYP